MGHVTSMPEKINMVDIARMAGVSLATASRALSNAPGVAAATRERVLAVAQELSYVVSPEASRLSGGSTRRVAVVVPHIARWFFAAMLEALESVRSTRSWYSRFPYPRPSSSAWS
jgi:DNA-binding LacI/PurR family transcriptional regulator